MKRTNILIFAVLTFGAIVYIYLAINAFSSGREALKSLLAIAETNSQTGVWIPTDNLRRILDRSIMELIYVSTATVIITSAVIRALDVLSNFLRRKSRESREKESDILDEDPDCIGVAYWNRGCGYGEEE